MMRATISFLMILFLSLPIMSISAQQEGIWEELKTTLPKELPLLASRAQVDSLLGKASLIEGNWHYYSFKGVNYPLAIKIVDGKMIGGNYQLLSPYPKIISLAAWKERLSGWKATDPNDGHDFGRYRFYTSADGHYQLKFKITNDDGVLDSFKWGDWK